MATRECRLTDETAMKGYIFHCDPDVLTSLALGMHDYDTVEDAKQAFVEGERSRLELEAILDHLLAEEDDSFNQNP